MEVNAGCTCVVLEFHCVSGRILIRTPVNQNLRVFNLCDHFSKHVAKQAPRACLEPITFQSNKHRKMAF